MQLTVLGSGTVNPCLERVSSGYWVKTARTNLLLDLGAGVLRRMVELGLEPFGLDALIFSHIHPDHTADLVPLLFALNYAPPPWRRERGLTIYGPTGFADFYTALQQAWPWVGPKVCPIEVVELGSEPVTGADWRLTPFQAVHSGLEARCYRLESGGRVLAYSGDTAPCPGLDQAAHEADLFLCECSLAQGMERVGDHMRSDEVGEVARRAGARRVVLTHLYPQLPLESLLSQASQTFGKPVEAASDGAVYAV
ncbi:MAG: ribonuclease Z [Candidatus Eremiobacteraeota bacterium]|nr:ribonuclease Z [Candidatus Eremiobacteraeota bacterium]